jgi:hypothetical protein
VLSTRKGFAASGSGIDAKCTYDGCEHISVQGESLPTVGVIWHPCSGMHGFGGSRLHAWEAGSM